LDYTTDPKLIFERWQSKIDLMLEDGYGGNIPSTVIDLSHSYPAVIRKGKGSLDLL
jgi:tRNA A37 threonylcarbamoyladenosine synthetase subunit TsaC/SUA5/YrdC